MIRFTKVRPVKSPCRGSALSAGIDFFVPGDYQSRTVLPGEDVLIPSGIRVELPEHTMLIGVDKSGVASSTAAKASVGMPEKSVLLPSSLIVGAKLIDADYPGEIHIHLINTGKVPVLIKAGEKVAQFVLAPVFYDDLVEVPATELRISKSERRGGFGSTN